MYTGQWTKHFKMINDEKDITFFKTYTQFSHLFFSIINFRFFVARSMTEILIINYLKIIIFISYDYFNEILRKFKNILS